MGPATVYFNLLLGLTVVPVIANALAVLFEVDGYLIYGPRARRINFDCAKRPALAMLVR